MQEEVTQKTIALSVKTARVTADVLKNMLRKYLSGQKQKGKNPYKVGKQSYKELKSQGSGLSNIEITDGNIKSFERVAKKYRLDFALKKDSSTKPPTYYVFFKGQDLEEQKKQAEDMEYLKIIRSNGVSAEELQLMIDISKEEQKKILETREKEQTENEEIS